MAVLLAVEKTSRVDHEVVGLDAHMQDLEGPQWLHSDSDFCPWATAKDVRKMG